MTDKLEAALPVGIEPYYRDEYGAIYHGDCLDVMRAMPDGCVDLVVTDPPYGFGRFKTDGKDYLDILRPRLAVLPIVLKSGGYAFVWSGTEKVLEIGLLTSLRFRRMLWMYKPNDCTYPWNGWLLKSEATLLFQNGEGPQLPERKPYKHDCYIHTGVGQEGVEGHPTVKPLDVIGDFVARSNDNDIILDPFLGSGTTAVAAQRLGRKYIGIEIEEKYCEIAKKRVMQRELFT